MHFWVENYNVLVQNKYNLLTLIPIPHIFVSAFVSAFQIHYEITVIKKAQKTKDYFMRSKKNTRKLEK